MGYVKSIGVYALAASVAYAAQVAPPTVVDAAADPSPGDVPHAFDASFVSHARVVPPYGGSNRGDYAGFEYRFGPFQVRPSDLHLELFFIVSLVIYSFATFIIRRRNRAKADKWFRGVEGVLRREFAGVGFGDHDKLYESDGGTAEFVTYVSGRRAIEHAWIKPGFNETGHDLLTFVYSVVRSVLDPNYDSSDKVVLDFKLAQPVGTPGAKNLCFAVLRREQLKTLQDARWDLRTFTTLSESVPIAPELIVMTESGDVTSALVYDPVTGLKDALRAGSNPVLDYFESLVVTDLPAVEPDSKKPSRVAVGGDLHLILTLRLASRRREQDQTHSTTKADAAGAAATNVVESLITLVCNVADVLHSKEKLLPEVAILKAKKRRTDTLERLLKDPSPAGPAGVEAAPRDSNEGTKKKKTRTIKSSRKGGK